jgi:NADP-dependent 3-hydroxy acid dehydrogenase YdfG
MSPCIIVTVFISFILVSKSQYLISQSLSPGVVSTDMAPVMWLEKQPHLKPEDIADAVVYVLGTPPHVQVRRTSARKTVTSRHDI